MRKKTKNQTIKCLVKGKDEIVRVSVLFFVSLTFNVFSKTNHFTVNAKSKCRKHDVEVYSFTCYMILLNCTGCVSSWFTCDVWVLVYVGTWEAWVKTMRGTSELGEFNKFQHWSINILNGYNIWRGSKTWIGSNILRGQNMHARNSQNHATHTVANLISIF